MSKETHPTSLGSPPHDAQSTATLRSTASQSSISSAFANIGRAANEAVQPSSTTKNRSIGHGFAAIVVKGILVPSDQASGDASDGSDNKSLSTQHVRKRDKIFTFFRSSSSKAKVKQSQSTKATLHRLSTVSTQYSGDIEHEVLTTEVKSPASIFQPSALTADSRITVFSENVRPPVILIALPEFGARIDSTPQLALCIGLLPKGSDPINQEEHFSQVLSSGTAAQLAWIKSMKQDPVEQKRLRWLGAHMVDEFAKDASKDSTEIAEMVLIGPVLDNEHYRRLLSCTITAFEQAVLYWSSLLPPRFCSLTTWSRFFVCS
ncbi:hypothetical protein BGZ88_000279, partial [Linnemannia elongata]